MMTPQRLAELQEFAGRVRPSRSRGTGADFSFDRAYEAAQAIEELLDEVIHLQSRLSTYEAREILDGI